MSPAALYGPAIDFWHTTGMPAPNHARVTAVANESVFARVDEATLGWKEGFAVNTDERVLRLIGNMCRAPTAPSALHPGLMLRHDLGIDSIGLVTVMFQFEEEFGVDLVAMEVDLSGIETVGDVLHKVHEILKRRDA